MITFEKAFWNKRNVTVLLAVLVLLVAASLALGAKGILTDLRFRVVPADPVDQLQKTVIRAGNVEISREEFLFYLEEVLAFPAQGDLVQRNFLWHYHFAERLARTYPFEVEDVVWRIAVENHDAGKQAQARLTDWVIGQADLFARFILLAERAAPDDATHTVLDTFTDNLYGRRLLHIVRCGEMEPNRESVAEFVAGLSAKERENIDTALRPSGSIKPFEEDVLMERVDDYQADLAKFVIVDRPYENAEDLAALLRDPNQTLVAIDGEKITVKDFLAIHGIPRNVVDWNQIKGTRLTQLVAAHGLATEAQRLRIDATDLHNRVALARTFYLAMWDAIGTYKPAARSAVFDVDLFRTLAFHGAFEEFRDWFIDYTDKLLGSQGVWSDKDFLKTITWKVVPQDENEARSLALPNRVTSPANARRAKPTRVGR
ncbi:MAG: hypothetical protein P9L99_03365 [Candidatus Lernaella stagnicola]|nr:hypothetical protein [Candidatus Lernaella stagnicola]